MLTVYLVRHGEVAGNTVEKRAFAGWDDLPLTEKGVAQAAAVAGYLASVPIQAVYASPLQRAWLTATGIAEHHGIAVQEDPGWREVSYGEWEGLTEADIAEGYPDLWRDRVRDPWQIAPPGGESYRDLWARLEPSWNRITAAHAGETVVVVAHNGPLRLLLCHLLEAPYARARSLVIGNCSLTKVVLYEEVDSHGYSPEGKLEGPPLVIEYINNVCHLEGI